MRATESVWKKYMEGEERLEPRKYIENNSKFKALHTEYDVSL